MVVDHPKCIRVLLSLGITHLASKSSECPPQTQMCASTHTFANLLPSFAHWNYWNYLPVRSSEDSEHAARTQPPQITFFIISLVAYAFYAVFLLVWLISFSFAYFISQCARSLYSSFRFCQCSACLLKDRLSVSVSAECVFVCRFFVEYPL